MSDQLHIHMLPGHRMTGVLLKPDDWEVVHGSEDLWHSEGQSGALKHLHKPISSPGGFSNARIGFPLDH